MTDDTATIRGRSEIAAALGRDEKTVSRWVAAGALPARRAGPFTNSPLICRAADIARAKEQFGNGDD